MIVDLCFLEKEGILFWLDGGEWVGILERWKKRNRVEGFVLHLAYGMQWKRRGERAI